MAIFDYKIGDCLRLLTQTCPRTEVTAKNIVRGLLGTDPPDPTLESALPSPPKGVDLASIQHRFDIDFLI